MKCKNLFALVAVIVMMLLPVAARAEVLCFHMVGYVMDGVKYEANNKEAYIYINFDGDRAYDCDAKGYKKQGNVMYFAGRDGSIVTYCAKSPLGDFSAPLGKILYNTSTGRLNVSVMGMTYIYNKVSAPKKSKPKMY